MQHRQLDIGREKTYIIVFEEGEEFSQGIKRFAEEQQLMAASFTAIGAFRDAQIGWFDIEQRDYHRNDVREQVEVLSLVGNVSEHEGQPKVHAHVVLGKKSGVAIGGHLMQAHIRPTLEVTLSESPVHLHRVYNAAVGLPLIRPEVEGLPPRGGRAPDAGTKQKQAPEPLRRGVGLGMGYAITPPPDHSDWKQCPDCQVWVHGLDRAACPQCGYVFGQQPARAKK